MQRRVLVIRPGGGHEAGLRTLARTGAEIVVADHPDSSRAGFADVHLPLPRIPDAFRDGQVGEVQRRILAFHERRPFTAIMADYDYLLPLVGALNDELGLRGHSEKSGLTCSNKRAQRIALDVAGVPQPSWTHCATLRDAHAFAATVGWPVVIKPTDRAASAAVAIARSARELDEALVAARAESWAGEVLVEEYVEGPEFSVESVVVDGHVTTVMVTGKPIGGRTGVLKLDAEMPADLDPADRTELEAVAAAAVTACGLHNGPAHTEVRLSGDGPRLVEVNGRVGGMFIGDMVTAVTGVDLYRAWYDVLHGDRPDLTIRPGGFAVRRQVADVDGVVDTIDLDDLPPEYSDRHLLTRSFVAPGDVLEPITDCIDIRAAFVAVAPDRPGATAAAEAMAAALHIRTRPLHAEGVS